MGLLLLRVKKNLMSTSFDSFVRMLYSHCSHPSLPVPEHNHHLSHSYMHSLFLCLLCLVSFILLINFQHSYQWLLLVEDFFQIIHDHSSVLYTSWESVKYRNSLGVQWLGSYVFTAESSRSIPGHTTKDPQAVWCGQKKRKRERCHMDHIIYTLFVSFLCH